MTEIGPLTADDLKNGIHSRVELENICRFHSDDLNFDGNTFALLMAISGCESSFGENNIPRWELGYSRSSLAYKRSELLRDGYKLYGDLCAMSYSAHQILWITARGLGYPLSSSPLDLQSSIISVPYVVELLNGMIKRGVNSVEQIGVAYNGGEGALHAPQAAHLKYATKLRKYYEDVVAS